MNHVNLIVILVWLLISDFTIFEVVLLCFWENKQCGLDMLWYDIAKLIVNEPIRPSLPKLKCDFAFTEVFFDMTDLRRPQAFLKWQTSLQHSIFCEVFNKSEQSE